MTKTNPTTRVVKANALLMEQGRRKNNKERRRKGEPTARPASYWLAKLSGQEIKALLDGESVTLEFNSGRVETLSVK